MGEEIGGPARNNSGVNAHERLLHLVDDELDDVLATIQLVAGDDALEARLFERLVDLLVERAFLDLRRRQLNGELAPARYTAELTDLARRCRLMGLLPFADRRL